MGNGKKEVVPTTTDHAQGEPMLRCVRNAGKTMSHLFLNPGAAL